MSSTDRLYNLLPAVYRQRDLALGEPLRAYLAVMETELQALEADTAKLYNNWFIETCDEWVITYIGDLLGIRELNTVSPLKINLRTQVANTLKFRASKGTATTLAQAATAATGWPTLVVESFKLLARTQSLNYLRLDQGQTVNVRQQDALALISSPFDQTARSVDVRTPPAVPVISGSRHKYNVSTLGLFLWRLKSYPVQWAKARRINDGCYSFSSFGVDIPLFNSPIAYPESPPLEITELNALHKAPPPNMFLSASSVRLENPGTNIDRKASNLNSKGVQIFLQNSDSRTLQLIPENRIQISDLSLWRESLPTDLWRQEPDSNSNHERPLAIVDPALGRIFILDLSTNQPEQSDESDSDQLWVNYAYGFSADIGGGPYLHSQPITRSDNEHFQAIVSQTADLPVINDVHEGNFYSRSLASALLAWGESQKNGTIFIVDSGCYSLEDTSERISISLERLQHGKQHALEIQAAEGKCPCLRGNLNLAGCFSWSQLTLKGLWIDGTINLSGTLALIVQDCTISPPKVDNTESCLSIQVTPNPGIDDVDYLQITVARSILGPIDIPVHLAQLHIEDSIVDGGSGVAIAGKTQDQSGLCLHIERTTIIGRTIVGQLSLADAVIFTDLVQVVQQHEGFIRHSYIPHGSVTPRRYHCQPDLALADLDNSITNNSVQLVMQPQFTSLRYGDPTYAQLSPQCSSAILTGTENGSEMGVFSELHQSQRVANLLGVLDEYVPYHMATGLFYIN